MNNAKNKSTSGVESGTSEGWESRLEEDFKRLVNPQRYASLYQQHWLPKGSQTPIYKLAQELNSNKDFTRYLVHLQIQCSVDLMMGFLSLILLLMFFRGNPGKKSTNGSHLYLSGVTPSDKEFFRMAWLSTGQPPPPYSEKGLSRKMCLN